MGNKIKWTDEVIQFMIDNYKGKDNIELAKLLNDKFNLNTNGARISNVKANLKRRKGIDLRTGINRGCIKKGNVPFNKGKKMSKEQYEKCKATMFKKGNIPPNRRELFEERIDEDGYIKIKIQDGKLNDNWKYKHRYIYEQHYGEIPNGYKVIFLDNNKTNFDINNLKLVSSAEELIMNNNNLRFNKKELTEAGHIIAKIVHKRSQLKNRRL